MSSFEDWCIHYRAAAYHDTCEAGVEFATIRRPETYGTWPCHNKEGVGCPHAQYPTPEQVREHEREVAAVLNHFFDALENWVCPTCGADVEREEQIGRCAYARPCGHRLYQGQARGERPKNLPEKGETDG